MQVGFDTVPTQSHSKSKVEPKMAFPSKNSTGVVLDNWRHAKIAYDEAKARLDDSRGSVLEYLAGQIDVGTTRFATDFFVLKTSQSRKFEVNGSDMNLLNQALTVIAGLCGNEVAGGLLTWKPSLNTKIYDSLPDEAKAEIDKFITMSYTSPTLSIEEIKK